MNCIKSKKTDLKSIVECHKSAFPDSLSTRLGSKFIYKMLEWYIVSERGVLFHTSSSKGEVIGYVGGIITLRDGMHGAVTSISQYAFKTFVYSYFVKPWLLFHKENLKKYKIIIKNILTKIGIYNQKLKQKSREFQPFIGLVVIGVKQDSQGIGLGTLLLTKFENFAKKNQAVVKITLSVNPKNINAIKSYKKNEWKISDFSKNSINMFKFIK